MVERSRGDEREPAENEPAENEPAENEPAENEAQRGTAILITSGTVRSAQSLN